jgi:hypothetical protein
MKTPVSFDGFIQIAIIVKDIEKAAKKWAEIFNVPVPEIKNADVSPENDILYRGEKTRYKLKLASIKAGNWVIELHETSGGDSTYQEFIDKHGYGVHHLGFQVGDKRDIIIGEMEDMGYKMRTVGKYPNGSWTIVDSENELGVNLNIKLGD